VDFKAHLEAFLCQAHLFRRQEI